jgi:AraC-like DNA-binding protein
MPGVDSWLYYLVAFGCFIGFIVSFILLVASRDKSFLRHILAAMLFCLSYSLFGYLLYISKGFLQFPHLFRTPVFFSLCVAPLTFLYVRSFLKQVYHFEKWDFLFFIPAVLYTLQLLPFYLLPVSEKILIIEHALQSRSIGAREPEGLLPQGIGFIFRMVYSLSIIVSTYITLIRWKKSTNSAMLKIHENHEIFRWLIYLSLILSSTFFILIIGYIFQITRFLEPFRISTLTVTITIFFICIYLLVKPNILYGLKSWLPLPEAANIAVAPSGNDEMVLKNRTVLSHDQIFRYKQLMEIHFINNRPFLKHRYSIKDLASEIGVPSYLLSVLINKEFGINFSEFINDIRVSYLIDLTKQNPENLHKYTLEVLGQMGGFKSRTTFILAVKRKTGKTPSEIFGTS